MRSSLSTTLLLLSLVLVAPGGVAEEQAPEYRGVAEEMSQEEFRGAGLDKLAPEELIRLDRWIEARTGDALTTLEAAAEPDALAVDEARRTEAEQQALIDEPFRDGHWVGPKPKRIEARIDGEFEGWQGNTVFVLDNGQVWRQRLEGRYYHRAESPEVLITRNFLGYFMLKVVATGQRIGVKRIR